MPNLQRFFNFLQQVDRQDQSLLGMESCLLLFSSTLALKPARILNVGIGNGDAALTLQLAVSQYDGGSLVCVQPSQSEATVAAELKEQLEQDGVQVIPDMDLDGDHHLALQSAFDLIAIDLSKINTTLDLPGLLTRLRADGRLFLYASVEENKRALLAQAAQLLPPPKWHFAVMTRQVDLDRPPVPDMLSVQELQQKDHLKGLAPQAADPQPPQAVQSAPIFLALPPPANTFGWGVCSRYISEELRKICPVHQLDASETGASAGPLPGKVFHALTGIHFESIMEQARGLENYAYTFFENELLPESVENAKRYDLVLGGSTWCMERMQQKGIANSGVLIQGIDPEHFYPIKTPKPQEKFVLFSGGKFEPRKGQDLVLAAFKALQDKYPDMVLVNCWHNLWPQSMDLMASSKWIRYERKGDNWDQIMSHIYALNGLDADRIFTIDLVPNETQRELYQKTDLGLFPNRCEGGTNLVLMEYMACAKPVIGAYSTGQRDVLSAENALLLEEIHPHEVRGPDNALVATWTEPSLDELIAQIEFAYHNREHIAALGRRAGEDLQKRTWAHTARDLLKTMGAGIAD